MSAKSSATTRWPTPPPEDFDYESKVWGEQELSLDPTTLGALRLRYCLEALQGVRGTVLELGCGAGSFLRALRSHRPDLAVVGLGGFSSVDDVDRHAGEVLRVSIQ